MKFQGVILLCCVLLAQGQEPAATEAVVEPKDKTTTIPPETTTVTTPAPPTTTNQTTTSAPTTTTEAPTTTSPTPAPKPAPTSPPAPTPDYPKNVGKWSVEDAEGKACIVLKGALQITAVHENKTLTISVPETAKASGACAGLQETQNLVLSWDSSSTGVSNTLNLTFLMNATKGLTAGVGSISSGKYGLNMLSASLYLNSTNATNFELDNIGRFQTPANHSYSCLAEESLKTTAGDFTLKIREVQLEAFRLTPAGHKEFSAAIQCPADDATDVVPIAVGAALAGLVVIVLIAYLIGRKRSRARGYQSV